MGRSEPDRRQTIADRLDRIIEWCKWPAALLAMVLLPAALIATVRFLIESLWGFHFGLFAAGVAVHLWFARRLDRIRLFSKFFSTVDRQLTRVLIALLSFHRIASFRSPRGHGKQWTVSGRGNWLITISPYFLPTLSILLLPVVWGMPGPLKWLALFLQGGAWAHHLWARWRETYVRQTDLQEVGRVFAWMFLPTANIVAMTSVLALAVDGWQGWRDWAIHLLWGPLPQLGW